MSEKIISGVELLAWCFHTGVLFDMEERIFIIGHFIFRCICFFCDLLHSFIPFSRCPLSCWLILYRDKHAKWFCFEQARHFWPYASQFVFPVFLVVDPPRLLEFFFASFVSFTSFVPSFFSRYNYLFVRCPQRWLARPLGSDPVSWNRAVWLRPHSTCRY